METSYRILCIPITDREIQANDISKWAEDLIPNRKHGHTKGEIVPFLYAHGVHTDKSIKESYVPQRLVVINNTSAKKGQWLNTERGLEMCQTDDEACGNIICTYPMLNFLPCLPLDYVNYWIEHQPSEIKLTQVATCIKDCINISNVLMFTKNTIYDIINYSQEGLLLLSDVINLHCDVTKGEWLDNFIVEPKVDANNYVFPEPILKSCKNCMENKNTCTPNENTVRCNHWKGQAENLVDEDTDVEYNKFETWFYSQEQRFHQSHFNDRQIAYAGACWKKEQILEVLKYHISLNTEMWENEPSEAFDNFIEILK